MFRELKINLFIQLISIIAIILFAFFIENEIVKYTLIGIFSSVIASAIYIIVNFSLDNYKRLNLYISILFKRTDFVRFSIAYLYRIQVEDKYLLVKSNRIKDFFQPVGGAYK